VSRSDGKALHRLSLTAQYLVRPDGHIAYRAGSTDITGWHATSGPPAAPTANHCEQAGLTGGRQPPQASSPCQASPPSYTANQATASAARGR